MGDGEACYFPDGSVSPQDIPCHSLFPAGGASACCRAADVCLNNKLCLAQTGGELISRGTCTDQTWQSLECPQICSDGNTHLEDLNLHSGVNVHIVNPNPNEDPKFCCKLGISGNETCWVPTKGSNAPFSVEAGLVIFNRTSGSTSPNLTSTITATVATTVISTATVTATKKASISGCPSEKVSSSSSSTSERDAAIGAGVSGLFGLALVVALVLLWRQGKGKRVLRNEVQTWEARYWEVINIKTAVLNAAGPQSIKELHGGNPTGLGSQPHLVNELRARDVDEIDGVQILEIADKTE